MARTENPNVKEAEAILQGKFAEPADILPLAKRLKAERRFGYARRILARARRAKIEARDLRLEIAQQHALCTYKDPDLPSDVKLDRALAILAEEEDLATTRDPETLGLAGAIYKRKWEVDAQKQHLERSLFYYRRGHEQGDGTDHGYTGINAAFLLDLLADQEEREATAAGDTSEIAETRRAEAREIRRALVARLPAEAEQPDKQWLKTRWWFLVTIAEAHFGLKQYDEARAGLTAAAALPNVPDWERETTARQLAAIARLQERGASAAAPGAEAVAAGWLEGSRPWEVLCEFLGDDADAVRSAFIGKVGLALSGGGFRASLFHIGVLARLAELDLLRHVEVLSCVSGGAIIGAHYYLELRKLLQQKEDGQITREEYLAIVQRIETEFLSGVQRNLRMRVIANPWVNLRMAFSDYSRTQRIGELYEEHLFSRVQDDGAKGPRAINDLKVQPRNGPPDFNPKDDNWRRSAKVPILLLNATSVNTGHNWQFTATWMGEPPASIDDEVDANYRLRRMYYEDAPHEYKTVRLGYAVGASSCVPGIFEPLAFHNLYPVRIVRLVDGGVHDNQGVAGLLEQGCTLLLVSDASGQNVAQDNPGAGILGTLLNANGILSQRVREAQYHDLSARRRSSLLRGLMFIHLRKDLEADPVDWIGCPDPFDATDEARPPEQRGPMTTYGILKTVQRRLSAVRTDLDTFNDAEAYALMLSGYRMTEREFARRIAPALEGLTQAPSERAAWKFLAIEPAMTQADDDPASPHQKLLRMLGVASGTLFKVWRLSRPLQLFGVVLGIAALAGLIWVAMTYWTSSLLTVGSLATMIGVMVLASLLTALVGARVGHGVVQVARFRQTLTRLVIGVATCLLGWLVALFHLGIFDPLYLREGRIDRVMKTR